jgi:UDP-glucose 4-epimerase
MQQEKNAKKLILVTGGAGFIGSHLVERLVSLGHEVISLDNYFTGSKKNHIEGAQYREGHTKNIAALIPENPDLVYHLGEYSRTAVAMEEPEVVLDFNMTGTEAVLEFCREKKCKLVYAGSSTKFADAREDGTAGRDLSPYTWSKAANTELVRNYNRWYDLPYATVYFYNVYGPRELSGKYGTAVEIFKEQYKKGEPLTVNAPGTQTRRYTHVLDTVDALLLVGEHGEGDEYGIASNDEYSTLDLAHLFSDDITMMPARRTSRPGANVDTSKIESLGWEQKRTLKEYVEEAKKAAR